MVQFTPAQNNGIFIAPRRTMVVHGLLTAERRLIPTGGSEVRFLLMSYLVNTGVAQMVEQ